MEATLAFPIFFFAVLAFLHLFRILYVQEHIQNALSKTVEKTSQYAYIYENVELAKDVESKDGVKIDGEWVRNILSDGFLAVQFRKEADTDLLDRSCIKGGSMGISFFRSLVMDREKEIDAVAEYKVKIDVPLLSLVEFPLCQRIKGRGFVGSSYDAKGMDEDEAMVYVTPTGKAYHLFPDCTYIKIITRSEVYESLASLRNDNGAKYYACERCVGTDELRGTVVYITDYGTRFHTVKDCSGIKRSVTTIPFSRVGDRHACSKCYQ